MMRSVHPSTLPMPLLPRAEYYAQLHKVTSAAGALFFDEHGRLLILKPVYREGYIIPGGTTEKNESPRQTCLREIQEELHLQPTLGMLLCLDYKSESEPDVGDESFQFIFDGGILSAEQIAAIVLDPEEHNAYRFVTVEEAIRLCNKKLAHRLPYCIRARETKIFCYLENGDPPHA